MSETQPPIAAEFYFDFISPFAWFASRQLGGFAPRLDIRLRPIVFAALLNHWGQKGPAEIPAKREWTYRWCTWWAAQQGIPLQMPAVHPFNPLPWLRLALAANSEPAAVARIFEAIWTTGANPGDPQMPLALAQQLGIAPERLADEAIKAALRANTDAAIEHQVFGVPTLRFAGQNFWGADALPLAAAYLDDPALFESPAMQRASSLPVGVMRKPA